MIHRLLAVFACCVALFSLVGCAARASTDTTRVHAADIQTLAGDPVWKGTLTYLDYTSNQPVSIPSTLRVTPRLQGGWNIAFGYDDEPHANTGSTLLLLDAGRTIALGDQRETVLERFPRRHASGEVRITTEFTGQDDNKPATIRKVYLLAPTTCSLSKWVRYEGSDTFIERHTYRWSR